MITLFGIFLGANKLDLVCLSPESNIHNESNGPPNGPLPGSDNTTNNVCTNECGVDCWSEYSNAHTNCSPTDSKQTFGSI